MSPKRLPGSSLSWVILIILWAVISAVPAKAEPGRHATLPAGHVSRSSSHSLSSLRHSIVSLAHRFHDHHRVHVVAPGSRALSLPTELRPADEDQAIQSGSLLCWYEPASTEPPAPTALLLASKHPPAECGEYSARRTPRGPPVPS